MIADAEKTGSHTANSAKILREPKISAGRGYKTVIYAHPGAVSAQQAMDIALDVDTALLRIGFDTSNISRT